MTLGREKNGVREMKTWISSIFSAMPILVAQHNTTQERKREQKEKTLIISRIYLEYYILDIK
jgi:hypothetical protein